MDTGDYLRVITFEVCPAISAAFEAAPGQMLMRHTVTVEIEGEDKPALIAEWLGLMLV